jgi:hypothetical protein
MSKKFNSKKYWKRIPIGSSQAWIPTSISMCFSTSWLPSLYSSSLLWDTLILMHQNKALEAYQLQDLESS